MTSRVRWDEVLVPVVTGVVLVAFLAMVGYAYYLSQTGYNLWVQQSALYENYRVICTDTDGTEMTFVPAK